MDPARAIEVAASSRTEAVNLAISRGDSDIQRFYKNSVVFLTGGSGFLGKQLTEKLLRSSDISKIYLLMRAKKGKSIKQRLDDILTDPVFDSLRAMKPDFSRKIVPVSGNVADLKLGIKHNDWKALTEEVNGIFHVAATTRFDETLQSATLINVRGTREALALGKACKELKSYVHVSTAYTHATEMTMNKNVPEEFGKSPIPPETLISMAEGLDEKRLTRLTPGLIKDWPNTYTFTKAVAEELVRETSTGLPISVVRPGIVLCTYSEPTPGWMDMSCMYGATGFLMGCGLGVVHTMYVNVECTLGFIPCDIVNNTIIAAGREAATSQARGGSDTRIYNVTTTNRNPITWTQLKTIVTSNTTKLASPACVYYGFVHFTDIKLVYMLLSLFLHIIPAYIADGVCLLLGKPARFANLAKKMYKMIDVLSYFLVNQWTFEDTNLSKLYDNLSNDDKIIFNFDVTSFDFSEYILIWGIGTRRYIIKDGLQGTIAAQKKQKVLKVLNYFILSLYVFCLWKLVCFAFYIVNYLFLSVINSV